MWVDFRRNRESGCEADIEHYCIQQRNLPLYRLVISDIRLSFLTFSHFIHIWLVLILIVCLLGFSTYRLSASLLVVYLFLLEHYLYFPRSTRVHVTVPELGVLATTTSFSTRVLHTHPSPAFSQHGVNIPKMGSGGCGVPRDQPVRVWGLGCPKNSQRAVCHAATHGSWSLSFL